MLVFALVILAAIVAAVFGVASGDNAPVEVDAFGYQIETTTLGILLTGLIAGFVAALMVVVTAVGLRRGRARRAERRLLRLHAADRDTLEAERDRLAAEKADLERSLGNHHAAVGPDGSAATVANPRSARWRGQSS